jgi:hypothetical protein
MGHAGKDMSDMYHKIKEGRGVPRGIDGADWFGLELPSVVPNVPKRTENVEATEAA